MGTQQILMIILSVIIVGTAIAVGIQMFDTQYENATRQALAAELMQQMSKVLAWYRTPAVYGGGGSGRDRNGDALTGSPSMNAAAQYTYGKNYSTLSGSTGGKGRNDLGEYEMLYIGSAYLGTQRVQITATANANPNIRARITFLMTGDGSDAVVDQNPPLP